RGRVKEMLVTNIHLN
ncbi:MAG: hypothetical protein GWN00_29535, partial [Aliifodinibius sp.]|nr:hypothetical protein [Fodinibius sp.]NIV12116.1 hypothetical protein [Fodinibius sp.]NIW12443.1 hypothetical protein [Candidatus Thorarchaeota archaeon]NIY28781.1 hypothetical protein [Fodinibius sp.]